MKNKSQFRSGREAKRFGPQQQKPLQNVLPTKSPALASTFSQALALHQAGRLAEAEKNYLQILKAQPNQFDCLHLLGVIFSQRGNHAEAVRQIDVALRINPKAAFAHNNRGNALQELKRFEEALASYDKALALKPDYAEAFNNRGNALLELKRFDEALASYDKALALKPDYAEAFNNRGNALKELKRLDEALASFDKALALKPDYAEAFYNRGNALQELKRFEEALASYDKALALKPDYAEAYWNEALLGLLTGDFGRGWAKYEWRWRNEFLALSKCNFSQPLWLGADGIDGKTVLLHSEQGFGDTIQFCRYVPLVAARCARVILEVERPLQKLMTNLAGATQVISKGDPLPDFDVQCPFLSLPLAFATRLETIPSATPYLRAPVQALKNWQARLGPKARPRIGLAWSGRPTHKNDQNRSISLRSLLPLLDIEATFVSLQKDVRTDDAAVLKERDDILDFGDALKDFSDTAALISHLDLVISVDTSVAHLAGALAKPVWVLLPFLPDWRWLLDRDDSPWYPTARLFRQDNTRAWDDVLVRVHEALRDFAGYCGLKTNPESKAAVSQPNYDPAAETARRRSMIDRKLTDFERWADEKQLEQKWDARAQRAADYIPAGAVVLDLGCGRMALEGFLPGECRYIPCDLVRRDGRTVVCDFNGGRYPDAEAAGVDLVSVLGVLEYIFDPRTFLSHLRQWRRPVVMSYSLTEGIRDREHRRSLGWVNDLSRDQLLHLFSETGFAVQCNDRIDGVQWLFRLRPNIPAVPAIKRVAVLSYNNIGNFGDRLGYHLINSVLPAHAEVTQLSLRPWTASDETYDFLVVGIGNSLFGPLLDKNLLDLADRSRAAIGIFGTQYHEALPRPMLDGLLGRLDHWYARYEDDVLRYGHGLHNVSHLGDWLIAAFPMTRATNPQRLNIGKEIWNDLPLDRTIQKIQRHTTVFSTRLHPLLCALTSADCVGYREQRESNGMVSGKFRSMLLDIFGRTFPEEELWAIDRDQVLIYKRAVEARVQDLRAHIHSLLSR